MRKSPDCDPKETKESIPISESINSIPEDYLNLACQSDLNAEKNVGNEFDQCILTDPEHDAAISYKRLPTENRIPKRFYVIFYFKMCYSFRMNVAWNSTILKRRSQ